METYYGHVRTPADAIILFEACRIGLLPRVQRRLSEKERQSIRSGSVFVWDEREAGMRRWTDGKSWSASRVSGSFLTYREMEGKRGGAHVAAQAASRAGKTPESNRGSDEDPGEGGEEGPDGYRYKPDGLMKQSFSITTSTGQHLHLISYYSRAHPTAPGLNQPSTDPALRNIRPQKGLYPESSINDQQNLPVVTRGPMVGAPYSVPPPPMAGYDRSGPPAHPHTYAPQYNWGTGALPAQSPQVPVMPYVAASYLPPPLAEGGGHPAVTYGHHSHPQMPPQPPHHVIPYDKYPQHAEASLPPPAHPAANAHNIPQYASSQPPPVLVAAPNGGPPQAHPPSTQFAPMDPHIAPSQADAHGQLPHSSTQAKPLPSITHHLTSGPSSDQHPPYNGPKSNADGRSSATVVPSINALMNAPPPPHSGPPTSLAEVPRTAEHEHNGVGPKGDATNGKPATAEGPKDIPSEKIGFGEDVRALRQLDRVFSA